MLRSNQTLLYWKGVRELAPALSALRGRHKFEKSLGVKQILRDAIAQSRHRHEKMKPWQRSIVRVGVGAVALELGTDWASLPKDLARQNVIVTQRCLHQVAQLEPLAFRCMVELSTSAIPPPPNTTSVEYQSQLANMYEGQSSDDKLKTDVARLLRPQSALKGSGMMLKSDVNGLDDARNEKVVEEWMDSWKEFDVGAKK